MSKNRGSLDFYFTSVTIKKKTVEKELPEPQPPPPKPSPPKKDKEDEKDLVVFVNGDKEEDDDIEEVEVVHMEKNGKDEGDDFKKGKDKKRLKIKVKLRTKSKSVEILEEEVPIPEVKVNGLRRSQRIIQAEENEKKRKREESLREVEDEDDEEEDDDDDFKEPMPKKKQRNFFELVMKRNKKPDPKEVALANAKLKARQEFLNSGLPVEILKSLKVVEKKQKEDVYLDTVGFFPKFSHNITIEPETKNFSVSSMAVNWPLKLLESSEEPRDIIGDLTVSKFSGFVQMDKKGNENESSDLKSTFCCKKPDPLVKSILTKSNSDDMDTSDDDFSPEFPWIEKYKVKRRKKLVVDKPSLRKFEGWLTQWKRDIDDDGGMSRKSLQKKRNSDSDTDFFTSEEEGEFKKKSVILCGPTGCGKTAMVYVISKFLGFKVVEVNFSSRRSGKDVMQGVEEATLSRQLSDSAEVDDRHCLILFKDVDLLHAEEDEGFHAAVAQLICSSVRPIVMTTCQPCTLDSKIEKKDPLWIHVPYPSPTLIVQKILLPMFETEKKDYKLDESGMKYIRSLLESIARHSKCDIRRSINQTQISFAGSNSNVFEMDRRIHQDLSSCLDFGHITTGKEISAIKKTNIESSPQSKAEKLQNIEDLDRISKSLELLADSDTISSPYDSEDIVEDVHTKIHSTLQSNFQIMTSSNPNPKSSFNPEDLYRSLIFKNDNDIANEIKINKLSDELSEYVDFVEDYDAKAYVRSILKTSVINSVGKNAKRNRRIKGYFNRVSPDFIQRVCDTFNFQETLDIAKAAEAELAE